MVAFLMTYYPIILSVGLALVSEGLSVVQQLKFPTNSGVGGVFSAILKVLQALGAQAPDGK